VVVMLPNCPEVTQSYGAVLKCPKQIRFVDSLPKSPIGKILRKELRTQA
jgi:acyl-coenzyme A synthetase/AMP-(fatty) acid ligase